MKEQYPSLFYYPYFLPSVTIVQSFDFLCLKCDYWIINKHRYIRNGYLQTWGVRWCLCLRQTSQDFRVNREQIGMFKSSLPSHWLREKNRRNDQSFAARELRSCAHLTSVYSFVWKYSPKLNWFYKRGVQHNSNDFSFTWF